MDTETFLTEQQLEKLEELAYNLLSIKECAIMLGVDASRLKVRIVNNEFKEHEYYRRGELRQLLEVNQEIIKQAKRGSSAHIKQLVEILKKKDIDNIL